MKTHCQEKFHPACQWPFQNRFALIAVLLIGLCLSATAGAQSKETGPYRKLDIFARVLSLIEQNHVEKIDEDALIIGAIEGMLRALDPHSSFMSAKEFKILMEDTEGNFCGVGMEVGIKENILTVIAPIPNSPAIRAGILPADVVVKINQESTADMDLMEAVQKMRGKENTNVTITIVREGKDKPFDVTLKRAVIEMQSVESELIEPGFIHLKIKAFQDGTAADVRKHLTHMKLVGGPMLGIVIDLRRNPGGLMYEAVKVSDLFVSHGTLLSTKGRDGTIIETFKAHRSGTFDKIELVVLIDGASASASEIVAGALQDNGRGLIVGTNSFGKGSVQTIIPLRGGAGLKLTTSRYYTPTGRSIQARGIEPDVVVESTIPPKPDETTKSIAQMPTENDLPGHLREERGLLEAANDDKEPIIEDFQLRIAFQILRGMHRAKALQKN